MKGRRRQKQRGRTARRLSAIDVITRRIDHWNRELGYCKKNDDAGVKAIDKINKLRTARANTEASL